MQKSEIFWLCLVFFACLTVITLAALVSAADPSPGQNMSLLAVALSLPPMIVLSTIMMILSFSQNLSISDKRLAAFAAAYTFICAVVLLLS